MIPWKGIPRTRAKYLLPLAALLLCHTLGLAQIEELVNQVDTAEQGAERISNSIFKIVKYCAGALTIISGLAFLIIREQNQDMARKIGNLVLGLLVFWVLSAMAENLAQ